jgi:hypothetical protein
MIIDIPMTNVACVTGHTLDPLLDLLCAYMYVISIYMYDNYINYID